LEGSATTSLTLATGETYTMGYSVDVAHASDPATAWSEVDWGSMAADTKGRIVTAAVELFNASSVGAVTTNHIAAHLGISPGNLYYHFGNKEEILRAAFARMNEEANAIWTLSPEEKKKDEKKIAIDPTALQRMLVGNLGL